jgi:hypothetical protein
MGWMNFLACTRPLSQMGMPEHGIDIAADLATQNGYEIPRPIDRVSILVLPTRAWPGTVPQA